MTQFYLPKRKLPPLLIDGPVEMMLRRRHLMRREDLAEKWDEEAVEATLSGSPRRAWYLNYMAERLRSGAFEERDDPGSD